MASAVFILKREKQNFQVENFIKEISEIVSKVDQNFSERISQITRFIQDNVAPTKVASIVRNWDRDFDNGSTG